MAGTKRTRTRLHVWARRIALTTSIAAAAFAGTASLPASASTARYVVTVGGVTQLDETESFSGSSSKSREFLSNNALAKFGLSVSSKGRVSAQAGVSGTVPATAQLTVKAETSFILQPPAGASFAGGTLVVTAGVEGDIPSGASLELAAKIDALTAQWNASGSGALAVSSQPGPDLASFDVHVQLPTSLDSARFIQVRPTFTLTASAQITGGQMQEVTAKGDPAKLVSFKVLDGNGQQVTGFTLKSGSGEAIPEAAPPAIGYGLALEYFNAAYSHYFLTANPDEIAKLDSGQFVGWANTGLQFRVYTTGGEGRVGVCRFYTTAFPPTSSHFYTADAAECEKLKQDPKWQFEGIAFYTLLPDANGVCPNDNLPVFRLYNNGQGGAPNHRFTTSDEIRVLMLGQGYISEGAGVNGVAMCSPP